MRRLLVLRPEPGASATVKRACEQGLEAVAVPLFEVEPMGWQAPEAASFDALLLTSANAIRHGGDDLAKLRGLRVYAVGEATAQAARDAGFDIAATGDAGVDRLLGSIEPDARLLHLCGDDRREPRPSPTAENTHWCTSLAPSGTHVGGTPDLPCVRMVPGNETSSPYDRRSASVVPS